MLSESQGHGEVKEGRQSLQGCIGSEFGCRCLTNGGVHHRVDCQRPIVVEERTDRPVHSIRPGGSSLLVAGEPTENHVVAGLLMAVTGEKLHGAVLVHEPSNWDSLFALTVRPLGLEVPFDSSRGGRTREARPT